MDENAPIEQGIEPVQDPSGAPPKPWLFKKNNAVNLAGRPKGLQDRVTRTMRDIAQAMTIRNETYLTKLRERLEAGKCAPPVETLILQYACGKPPDKLEITGPDGQPLGAPNLFEARARMLELLAAAYVPATPETDAYQDDVPAPCESDRMLSNSAETQNAERAGTEPVPGTLDDRQGESETSAERVIGSETTPKR